MGTFSEIISDHIHNTRRIRFLAGADLVKEYRGAVFGWAWALMKPTITILVFWFAFSVGLRRGVSIMGYPFFLWLIAGFVPWFFMRDSITNCAGSIRKYKYLVQKVRYPVDTIPTSVCLSQLVTNMCLVALLLAIYMIFGYMPDIYWLQLPLCYLMAFAFFTPLGLLAAMLSAMSKDFLNFTRAMVTALFWLSGIIYDAYQVQNEIVKTMLLANPVTIIVNRFRDCMIYNRWFYETPGELANYAVATVLVTVLATWAYGRLRKRLPDVL